MKTRTISGVLFILFFSFFFTAGNAFADSMPDRWAKDYLSPNGRYKFRVTPRLVQSSIHYFYDKKRGIEPAGAVDMQEPGYCKGEFFILIDGEYHLMWRTRLVNDVAPVGAVVSDNGRYVATFDNWQSSGYGDNVVVIYMDFGWPIFKLRLEDILTEFEIKSFVSHTTGSRWWRKGDAHIEDSMLVIPTAAGERALSLKSGKVLIKEQ